MSDSYAIGEVCEALLLGDTIWREAVILSRLRPTHNSTSFLTGQRHPETFGHEVDIKGLRPGFGCVFCIPPERLRKRKPPREGLQVVRWAECPWQPDRITQIEAEPSQ